jgi:hypothetical protein
LVLLQKGHPGLPQLHFLPQPHPPVPHPPPQKLSFLPKLYKKHKIKNNITKRIIYKITW